jgi:hypothetical protein
MQINAISWHHCCSLPRRHFLRASFCHSWDGAASPLSRHGHVSRGDYGCSRCYASDGVPARNVVTTPLHEM